MKKRIVSIIGIAALAVSVITVSAVTLTNTKGNDIGRNADSPEQINMAGEILDKADDQEKMPLDHDTIYTDNDNTYYINNDNGYLELVISDNQSEDKIAVQTAPLSNSEIIEKAKNYVEKWYPSYAQNKFEWSIETDTETTKRIYMRQIINDKEVGTIAAMTYDNYGNLVSGSFWFDAVLSEEQVSNIISEEKALELAGNILENEYSTSPMHFDDISICTNTHSGHNYWYIMYKTNGDVASGYIIEIEKLTGEIGNVSELR